MYAHIYLTLNIRICKYVYLNINTLLLVRLDKLASKKIFLIQSGVSEIILAWKTKIGKFILLVETVTTGNNWLLIKFEETSSPSPNSKNKGFHGSLNNESNNVYVLV